MQTKDKVQTGNPCVNSSCHYLKTNQKINGNNGLRYCNVLIFYHFFIATHNVIPMGCLKNMATYKKITLEG